jgi:two-component system response regulator YesN
MWTTLILEDSALYRRSLLRIFEAHFPAMGIFDADTGQKARQIASTEVLDLVLTDIDLPDMSGLDFTREVKRGCASTLVVILTIHDAPEYRLAAQEHGADYFLVKGFTGTADIVALVESVVAQKKKSEDRCDNLDCQMRRDAYW